MKHTKIELSKLHQDYDSYVLTDNDKNRIKPIKDILKSHGISFKYWARSSSSAVTKQDADGNVTPVQPDSTELQSIPPSPIICTVRYLPASKG